MLDFMWTFCIVNKNDTYLKSVKQPISPYKTTNITTPKIKSSSEVNFFIGLSIIKQKPFLLGYYSFNRYKYFKNRDLKRKKSPHIEKKV